MEVCRFCLSELKKQRDRVKIDEAVKKVYYEFMSEEVGNFLDEFGSKF